MGRVSITTDCWTSLNNNNFICVTAHYIGKDWILHKKIINFSKITSHKGEDIGAAIVTSLTEWGWTHLFSCTLDNASQNDIAIGVVKTHMELMNTDILGGKYFHMRCVAHILNLIVKDGLKEIGISIRRVREAVRWLKSSPQRWGLWEKVLDYLGDKIDSKKKLCMDVPTRWNSTYLMLESAIPYAEAFTTFGNMNSSFGKDLHERMHDDKPIGPPEEEDWVNVKKMMSYLKKFHSFTQIVSVTKRPTSHLFFTEMCGIFDLIRRLEMSSDYEVSSMASRMRLKIGKYWMEETELNVKMNKIIYMAAILDPRQKMKHVETCLKLLYGNARGLEMVKEVRDSMSELFVFYSARYAPRPPSRSSVDANVEDSSDEEDTYNMFAMDMSDDDENSSNETELDLYLTDRRHRVPKEEMASFDLLKWWSEHTHYHVLSAMARDILAIPVSSVASESAFSMGGRVLSPYRSSLTCTMVEALICAGDWLKTCDLDKKDEEDVDEEE
ncbi:hypothetical protein AAHA92_02904 [Salvia divinorum]|uniref:Transposase n=1 Tax=Salvia divinorum TaxID=28513 RepID=A0ABD1IFD5_SALDI